MGAAAEERCELCGAPAAVHCEADAAYLCPACDARVHGANFLASRHRRTRLAAAGCDMASGEEEGEEEDGYESSAASSCVCTADSAPTAAAARLGAWTRPRPGQGPRRGARAEAVLEVWAKRMGLPAGEARGRAAAAARAIRACGPRAPPRVAMAAALWSEAGGAGRGDALRGLEACAHVPARLVVAVASSMARERARRRRRRPAVEGWDECSWAGPKSNQARS